MYSTFTIIQFPIDRMNIWCAVFFWNYSQIISRKRSYPIETTKCAKWNQQPQRSWQDCLNRKSLLRAEIELCKMKKKSSFNWAIFILLSGFFSYWSSSIRFRFHLFVCVCMSKRCYMLMEVTQPINKLSYFYFYYFCVDCANKNGRFAVNSCLTPQPIADWNEETF